MQFELPLEGASRLTEIHRRLMAAYGPPLPTFRLDPVSQLVLSMLGARTHDHISRRYFSDLANHHPRWEELIQIPYADFSTHISGVTHAERKAVFIPQALRGIIERRRRLDLDFLSAWPVDDALAWLDALRGVGPKTSAAVLNFSTLHQRAGGRHSLLACGAQAWIDLTQNEPRQVISIVDAANSFFLDCRRYGKEFYLHEKAGSGVLPPRRAGMRAMSAPVDMSARRCLAIE